VSLKRSCLPVELVVLTVLVAMAPAAAQEPASGATGWPLMYGLDFRPAQRL
jgi:hypothetical protein